MFVLPLARAIGFCCAVIGFGGALAAPALAAEPSMASLVALEKSLKYQKGDVVVGSNLATLHLGNDYRFLSPDDARKVLVEGWGNPPSVADDVLGMIAPAKTSPLAEDSWGVVVSYVNDGHVDDADAAKINYSDLLSDLKKGIAESNAQRKRAGYEMMNLVGWARTPTYDSGAKKLIWAKEIAFEGSPENTLNYDVRVLGRRGVLSLNAVGVMSDLPKFETAMADVAKHAEFNGGERYADFSHSAGDKVAAYGVAGLIAGGAAAKAGLFKGILLALVAAKKFVVMGLIALVALAKKGIDAVRGGTPNTAAGGNSPRA